MALTPQLITRPKSGIIGLPAGTKEAGKRVDFRPDEFDFLIETKGYRLAWSRACQCPCKGVNQQTDQADPNCTICEGASWFYFAPSEPISNVLVGDLDSIQQAIITRNKAGVIRGIMSAGTQKADPYNQVVNWVSGQMMCTVRAPNKLGYYDKLVNLDSEVVYTQLVKTDDSGKLTLRYLATGVNLIRSIDIEYIPDTDYQIIDGEVVWVAGKEPADDTLLVCHYTMHPTWLITEHPHVIRTTPVKFKTASPKTPQGDPRPLPIQAVVQLDFLR